LPLAVLFGGIPAAPRNNPAKKSLRSGRVLTALIQPDAWLSNASKDSAAQFAGHSSGLSLKGLLSFVFLVVASSHPLD
jgi:hypothetical protein